MTIQSKQVITGILCCTSSLALMTVSQMPQAYAASLKFSAMGTNSATSSTLKSSVIFNDSLNPGKLTITLTNIGAGAKAPSDVLTSLFWDYNGSSPLNLSLVSATAATVITNGTNTSNVNLLSIGTTTTTTKKGKTTTTTTYSPEWAFASNSAGLGGDTSASGAVAVTQHYGIGTAGLGIFQGIGGTTQQAYGIINGYSSSANSPIKTNPFVNNSATFVFSGLTAGFDINKISNVRFQYGTNLNEPYYVAPPPPPKKVPEPSTAVALGLFAIGGLRVVKKKSLLAV